MEPNGTIRQALFCELPVVRVDWINEDGTPGCHTQPGIIAPDTEWGYIDETVGDWHLTGWVRWLTDEDFEASYCSWTYDVEPGTQKPYAPPAIVGDPVTRRIGLELTTAVPRETREA